jgi:cytochrome bd-type quinol oxidase subunit 1
LPTGIPVCVAGTASAFFVVSANAWMNQPRGFDLDNGQVVGVNSWQAMFNPATPHQTIHMILAACSLGDHRTRPVSHGSPGASCAPATPSPPVPGLLAGLIGVTAVYLLLTVGTVHVLRRLARSETAAAPQESEAEIRVHR